MTRLYEAWQRDGFGVVPELMDPSIEWVNPAYAVEPGTRHGYDGFSAAVEALARIYPDYRVSPLEFHEAGDNVAVRAKVVARTAGNAPGIDTERGYAFRIRDNRIVCFSWFNRPEEALEAIGLGRSA